MRKVLVLGLLACFLKIEFTMDLGRFYRKRRFLRSPFFYPTIILRGEFFSTSWIIVLFLERPQINIIFLKYFGVLTLNFRKPNILLLYQIILKVLNFLHQKIIFFNSLLSSKINNSFYFISQSKSFFLLSFSKSYELFLGLFFY
jgi:hypothetical protein